MKTTAIKNEDGRVVGARYEHTPREIKEIIDQPQCKGLLLTAEKIEKISGYLQGKGYSQDQIGNALMLCNAYCEGKAQECQIKSESQGEGEGEGGDVDVDTGLLVAVIKEVGKANRNTAEMARGIQESIKNLQVDKHDLQNALFETEQTAKRALGKMELTVDHRVTELSEELHGRLDQVEANLRQGRVVPVPRGKTVQPKPANFLTEYEKTGGFNPNAGYDPYDYFDVPIQVRGEIARKNVELIGMPGS